MRSLGLLVCLAACRTEPAQPAPAPAAPPRRAAPEPDAVIDRAAVELELGRIDAARRVLERQRWYARDRARAALLLCGCLLAEGKHGPAVDALRTYLEKTPRQENPRDATVIHLLRHHAGGGGLKARSAEEACYIGLYALKALKEPDTARPDLEWALKEAPAPERRLVELSWGERG